MYAYCVECFAHVYCDSACGWNGLVETCCDSVVDVVMSGVLCMEESPSQVFFAITDRRDSMMLASFHA